MITYIKLTCLIGLVIAPILGGHSATTENVHGTEIKKEINVEVTSDATNTAKAVIITTITKKGETIVDKK